MYVECNPVIGYCQGQSNGGSLAAVMPLVALPRDVLRGWSATHENG